MRKLSPLFTYSFSPNVGRWDRVFRIVSGVALAATGWVVGLGPLASGLLTASGIAWALTGLVSRCGVYYLLGYSTCPVSGRARQVASEESVS
ncbi:MAG: DUF2892 domain-containing protein [Myxococcota bacterium]|nr:DUF2892 domain-containing protein [Myxococcota bacterium]